MENPRIHRRESDPDTNYHERREDHDKVAKYGYIWDRYVKLFIPFIWVIVAWFFLQLYPAVKGYPEVIRRLDEATQSRIAMTISLNILIRMQCLELDALDRAKIDLDCSRTPLPTTAQLETLRK